MRQMGRITFATSENRSKYHKEARKKVPGSIYLEKKYIKKLVLCSGKVAFDIEDALAKAGSGTSHGVRLVRIEEIAPFPVHDLRHYMGQLGRDTEVVWVQEESLN